MKERRKDWACKFCKLSSFWSQPAENGQLSTYTQNLKRKKRRKWKEDKMNKFK